jgi:DNA mismatch repair endonuclease MutH
MTGEEALKRITKFIGKTLEQITDETAVHFEIKVTNRANKGWLGIILEIILGKTPDNKQLPDLDDGTEVKKVSIVKGVRGYRVKETLQVTMINPNSPLETDFTKSHLHSKTRKILLIPTLYAGKGNHEKEILLPPVLWQPDENFDSRLRKDYELVAGIVSDRSKGFRSLSGKLGDVVQPRTKGAKNSFTRAFYLRTQSVKEMLGENYLAKL